MMTTYFCWRRPPWYLLWIVYVGIPVLVGAVSTEMSTTTRNEAEQQQHVYSMPNARIIENNFTVLGFKGSGNVSKIDSKKIHVATTLKIRFKRSAQTSLELIDAVKKILSEKCRGQVDACSSMSEEAKAGHYCHAFKNSLAQTCITMGDKCSEKDFIELKAAACYVMTKPSASSAPDSRPTQEAKKGLAALSPKCLEQIALCQRLPNPSGSEDHCEIMRSSSVARKCLTGTGACTGTEFNILKNMACTGMDHTSPGLIVYATPATTEKVLERIQAIKQGMSKKCQGQIDFCNSMSPEARKGNYCAALRSPLAEGCITTSGTCSEEDFDKLKATACTTTSGGHRATNVPPQATIHPVLAVISSLSKTCQKRIQTCSEIDSQGKQNFMQVKYCQAFGSEKAKVCLLVTEECNDEEYKSLRGAACGKAGTGAPSVNVQLLVASFSLCILRWIG